MANKQYRQQRELRELKQANKSLRDKLAHSKKVIDGLEYEHDLALATIAHLRKQKIEGMKAKKSEIKLRWKYVWWSVSFAVVVLVCGLIGAM